MERKDDMERREGLIPATDRDSRIQVVVSQPQDAGALEIDLVRVFRNMKRKFRIFAWVILLCFAAGICVPLLMYQVNKKPLTVSSVVTLRYGVSDLTAPNGSALDLNQITSSYVLQAAMDGLELSRSISLAELRSNICIERILTKESRRQQEIASSMLTNKNSGAYAQVQNIDLAYTNQFVVSLTNGFGSAGSELTDTELRTVLDRVLTAYNDYLVTTYADIKLPDDEFAAIDLEKQDILEGLDLLRSAEQKLYSFCSDRSSKVRGYRSSKTGRTLSDLMKELQTVRSVNLDYLYSYVTTYSIVRDRDSTVTGYRYQLRLAQTSLAALNENIATIQDILDNYQNDQIYVPGQEEEAARSIQATTDYYNQLVMEKADDYDQVARLEERIADLEYKLDKLNAADTENAGSAQLEKAVAELNEALRICREIYTQICEQLEEIYASTFFNMYAEHTVAQGSTSRFLSAASKKMVIGGVAGVVIACGLWFLSALALEFRSKEEEDGQRKEAEIG